MPMHELPGGGEIPIRLWADPAAVEPQALQQLYNVSTWAIPREVDTGFHAATDISVAL